MPTHDNNDGGGIVIPPHPCQMVRTTCRARYDQQELVMIHDAALLPLAEQVRQTAAIAWDEEGWHYVIPNDDSICSTAVRRERMALYILALDAINFCFWPTSSDYEYDDLATSLKHACSADHAAQRQQGNTLSTTFCLHPRQLCAMTATDLKSLLSQYHARHLAPPDIEVRCQLWNEIGRTLLAEYDGGSVGQLLDRANGSAVQLVRLVMATFPGFCDYSDSCWFLKRAQICVADWNAALQLNLPDMAELTTFADYRVPQLLRHVHVLQYHHVLAQLVDAQTVLPAGSVEEQAIRASTVVAVERLVRLLNASAANAAPMQSFTDVQIDWYLWQVGEKLQKQGQMEPFHRVRTTFY